ncbi:MAG: hypothetical protein ACP5F8_03630, partial [Candidatus Aenigmatarchaeota archaeon]
MNKGGIVSTLLILGFWILFPASAHTAYIFHDGKHYDHIQVFMNLLKSKEFYIEEGTFLPSNLTNYTLLILEFDSYGNPYFDWREDSIREYIRQGGIFIGAGDGGMLAVLKILNSSYSDGIYYGSLDSMFTYTDSLLFKEYKIDDVIQLGSAASYHLTYGEGLSPATLPLLRMLGNNKLIAVTNDKFTVYGFTLGCGGWVNIPNCTYVYSSFIDHALKERVRIFSPLNKTYFTTQDFLSIPLNLSIFAFNQSFNLQIFIDENLFLNKTFENEAKINEILNQSIGNHCISVFTN